MSFFKDYFTKHPLPHSPYGRFLALLRSPLYFAEKHYQKRYRLNFQHAKKLFIFDILLLLSTMLLALSAVIWFTYKPHVTALVNLLITPSAERIKSGEFVSYKIEYQNNSDTALLSPRLKIFLPPGFITEGSLLEHVIEDIPAEHGGSVEVNGWSFGTPDTENKIRAELSYQQEKRGTREVKKTTLYQIHRGSVLETDIFAPTTILAQGSMPVSITVKNSGKILLEGVSLSMTCPVGLVVADAKPQKGVIKDNVWQIDELKPDESINLSIKLQSQFPPNIPVTELVLISSVKIKQRDISQQTVKHRFKILNPRINFSSDWKTDKDHIKPGEVAELELRISNDGNAQLKDLSIGVPLPSGIIDYSKILSVNSGKFTNQTLTINKSHAANLTALPPGESTILKINLPLLFSISVADDLRLTLNPRLSAQIKDLDTVFESAMTTPPVKVGTHLNLQAETRYYTNDGDQLGRGPLPPQVGKETKYWILFKIINTTSKVSNVKLNAALPDYVRWTDKSSVSDGQSVKYSETNRTISWTLPAMSPHSDAGVYFEIAVTPTNAQINLTPTLIKDITLTAHEEFINTDLFKTHVNLDAALPTDKIAQQKGVKVR